MNSPPASHPVGSTGGGSVGDAFRAWQSCRWTCEIKARLLDKAMDDAIGARAPWPSALLEEFDALHTATQVHYLQLLRLVRVASRAQTTLTGE